MKKALLSLGAMGAIAANLAVANPIARGTDNDPKYIVQNAATHFDSLPKAAKLNDEHTPWSSSFWPHVYGGIAFRWNGHYQGEPSFAPLHYEVDEINEEIERLEKSLYESERSREENLEIMAEISRLKSRKTSVNAEKAKRYQKLFFDLERPKRTAEVQSMGQAELDRLSPAEKFDAYVYLKTGRENHFELTRDVMDLTSSTDAYWEGICHGWASASLEFAEPEPRSYSADGVTVNFGSSDLKALLSYYHAAITGNWIVNRKVSTGRVGNRCETTFPKHAWFIKDGKEYYKKIVNGSVVVNPVPSDCVDTNPGSFHIVLANMIGLKGQGFSAEIVRDKEVWNQPVYRYETKVVSRSAPRPWAARGAVSQVEVKTRMYYSNDGGRMFWRRDGSDDEFYAWWEQTVGTPNFRYDSKDFHYYLDLDAKGNIIGGQWLSYERPDFLWLKKSRGFVGTGMWHGVLNHMDHLRDLVRLQER